MQKIQQPGREKLNRVSGNDRKKTLMVLCRRIINSSDGGGWPEEKERKTEADVDGQ